MNGQAGDTKARKAAAQAVIELTDRLAAAEEEAAALRRHLKNTRSLTKVFSDDRLLAARIAVSLGRCDSNSGTCMMGADCPEIRDRCRWARSWRMCS